MYVGKWNGIVSSLLKDTVDLSAAAMIISSSRASAVDFLPPMGASRYAIFIKNSQLGGETVSWRVYLSPFNSTLWIFLAIVALFIAFVTTALSARSQTEKSYLSMVSYFLFMLIVATILM